MHKPLEDILVVDFSQFLSGPSASLKLADLGARVIKIERPKTGDICRQLYISNVTMNGDSSVFHAINRNKESFTANLKNEKGRQEVWALVKKADIIIHNFRPGVMKRLGFDYESVQKVKSDIIYGEISGYGNEGPWKDKPGQDLLVQALSGMTWLSGNAGEDPVPMGLSIVDILAGAHLAQGILACLVRRSLRHEQRGGIVQVSMLESAVDFQFETITTFYQDGGEKVHRSEINNAHAYLGAPYGIYQTKDGSLALAMASISELGELLECEELLAFTNPGKWYEQRDAIKTILAHRLQDRTTEEWLGILEPADIWCADVLSWDELMESGGFKALDMIQRVYMGDGFSSQTMRSPLTINGNPLFSSTGAPKLGEHTDRIREEFIE